MPKRAVLVILLLTLWPVHSSGQVRVGSEFRVNADTAGNQAGAAVAWRPDGHFVVVWHGAGEGDGYGVFTRRFGPNGVPTTPGQTRLNADTDSYERFPSLAVGADGRTVVLWSDELDDFSDSELFARPIDAAGNPGTPFRVNTYTTGHQRGGSVAIHAGGDFVVVWTSDQDGSGAGIVGQRFSSSGLPQFGEFPVNSYTTGGQSFPSVAPLPGGGFVVVWASDGQDGSGYGVFGQRFGSSGTPQGAGFQVNTWTTGSQWNPRVAADATGRVSVIWTTFGQGAIGDGLFGRRFDPSGTPEGGAFAVSTSTTAFANYPALASDANGNFVAAWTRGSDVYARRYDADGTPGAEFRANSYTPSDQRHPGVSMGTEGHFVVVWDSIDQDGSQSGIFAQRFAPDAIFQDGFESGDLSAWSASDTDGGLMSVWTGLDSTGWGAWGEAGASPALYVQDDSPRGEDRYRARFFFDPVNFDPGEAEAHRRARIFIVFQENPTRRLAALVLRRVDGEYGLLARARLDDDSQYDVAPVPITAGPHFVELDWKRSSGPDANDGWLRLWVDGASIHTGTTLDNSLSSVDFVRMGVLSVKSGASGTLIWDEFTSRRTTFIGR